MIRTTNILFWFGLSIAASLALYHTSDRTRELEDQLRQINASVEDEQEKIHVLRAEWVYLGNPSRVETAAKKFLALKPTAPKQVIAMDNLDQALPTREEKMAAASVPAPVATVKTTLAVAPAAPARTYHPRKIAVTVADRGHINDHMVLQHAAKTRPSDEIGSLIADLDTHR